MDHLGETYPPCPTRKFPNSLLESHHRFRRDAPLRLLVIREAESQEFPFPWSCHRTLLAVYPKLELRREESRHAAHHSFAGSPTADVWLASALSGIQTISRRSSRRGLGCLCWPSLVVAHACSFPARRLPRRPSGLHPYSPP